MKMITLSDGTVVATGEYTETATEFKFADRIIPKTVVQEHKKVDLPIMDAVAGDKIVNNALVKAEIAVVDEPAKEVSIEDRVKKLEEQVSQLMKV